MLIIILAIVLAVLLTIQTIVLALVMGTIDIVRGIKKQTRRHHG